MMSIDGGHVSCKLLFSAVMAVRYWSIVVFHNTAKNYRCTQIHCMQLLQILFIDLN